MQRFLIILLVGFSLIATAHDAVASTLKTRISDDSRTLSIQIDGNKDGRPIHVNQVVDVAGMNTLQKELIKYRTFTAVGVAVPLHEIPWLLALAFGLPAFIIALVIARNQRQNVAVFP